MKPDTFKNQLAIFTSGFDPIEHNEAIISMFDSLDLDIEYKKLTSEGGGRRVLEIFTSFSDTSDDLINEYDKKSLEQVGELSKKYFLSQEYSAFAKMVFELTVESLLEYYNEVDNKKYSHNELYSFIEDEIYLQVFLLDIMAHKNRFDWNRNQKIVEQSLMALTVCFSDIYSFLVDEEEDDDMAD